LRAESALHSLQDTWNSVIELTGCVTYTSVVVCTSSIRASRLLCYAHEMLWNLPQPYLLAFINYQHKV